jgi:hypothetical protein
LNSINRSKRSIFIQFLVYFAILFPLVFTVLWKPSLLFELSFELIFWGGAFSWIVFLGWDIAFSEKSNNPSWLVRFKHGGSVVHCVLLFGYAAYLFLSYSSATQDYSFVHGLMTLGSVVLISFFTGLKAKKLAISYIASGIAFYFLGQLLFMGTVNASIFLIALVTLSAFTYLSIDIFHRRAQIISKAPVESIPKRFLWSILWTIFSSIVGIACALLSLISGYLALIIFPQSMRAPAGFVWWSTGSGISGFGYVIGLYAGVIGVLLGFYAYSKFIDWADNITARTIGTKLPSAIGFLVGIITFIGIIVYSLFFL